MTFIKTPWGEIRVEDAIDTDLECDRCGTCCKGFILSVSQAEIQTWYERFLEGSDAYFPPDVGAVKNLFVRVEGRASGADPIFACPAFDSELNRCTLMPGGHGVRPIACYAFPYVYDLASLKEFPYPQCGIYKKALRRLNTMLLQITWERFSADLGFGSAE